MNDMQCRAGIGLIVLLIAQMPLLASKEAAKPDRADQSSKTGRVVTTQPPFYSVRQLKRWVEQEKARAKQRLKALQKQGVRLSATQRHRLEEATEYLEALLFYLQLRAYPYDSINWQAYLRATEHRDAMTTFTPASGARWEFIGPRNLSPPYRTYFGAGPVSGRVNTLAYHPIQEGVYYMGAPQGGLRRSTDYGATWQPLGDSWLLLQATRIAIHPTNPDIL